MKNDFTPDLINAISSLFVTVDEHRFGAIIICATVVMTFAVRKKSSKK